jgi:hypothetical protein
MILSFWLQQLLDFYLEVEQTELSVQQREEVMFLYVS